MLRRGLKSLDELDATKEAERLAKVDALVDVDSSLLAPASPDDLLDP
jgi:hypothetical protein